MDDPECKQPQNPRNKYGTANVSQIPAYAHALHFEQGQSTHASKHQHAATHCGTVGYYRPKEMIRGQ